MQRGLLTVWKTNDIDIFLEKLTIEIQCTKKDKIYRLKKIKEK